MSRVQHFILTIGLFAVLLAAAFPPWRYVGTHTPTATYDVSAGYGFVFAAPVANFREGGRVPADRLRVDGGLLLAELAAIVSVTGLFLTWLRYDSHQAEVQIFRVGIRPPQGAAPAGDEVA